MRKLIVSLMAAATCLGATAASAKVVYEVSGVLSPSTDLLPDGTPDYPATATVMLGTLPCCTDQFATYQDGPYGKPGSFTSGVYSYQIILSDSVDQFVSVNTYKYLWGDEFFGADVGYGVGPVEVSESDGLDPTFHANGLGYAGGSFAVGGHTDTTALDGDGHLVGKRYDEYLGFNVFIEVDEDKEPIVDIPYKFIVYMADPVPEPQTWSLLLTGFLGAGAILRRRRTLAGSCSA